MTTTTEFVNLCRSQVALLTQSLGAALSVIYLKENLVETDNNKLIPILVYPEIDSHSQNINSGPIIEENYPLALPFSLHTMLLPSLTQPSTSPEQIVLPLMYENIVMGLLVTEREDRPWTKREKTAIEKIAHTIAIACMMDQRLNWYEQKINQQEILTNQQHNLLDDLLHQFKNPLTALRTFSKLLIRRLLPQDNNKEVAQSIGRETERLQELLQQFEQAIDLSITDINLKHIPAQSANLTLLLPSANVNENMCLIREVLAPLIDNAEAIAWEKGLTITVAIPDNLPPVQGNGKALREVFSNIIDNALKYTPAPGQIRLQVGEILTTENDKFQIIEISDTGLGISQTDLDHVFERNYRGEKAQSDIPGTGLGLGIVKDLLTQMGGNIQVFSPSLYNWGENITGTTVIIWLKTYEKYL
ncbi:MAG TPA: ATP-binding protein [Allocoleopsis sp.]